LHPHAFIAFENDNTIPRRHPTCRLSHIQETTIDAREKEGPLRTLSENRSVGQIDFRAIKIDCYTAIDTGLYPFAFGDGWEVKARYAFTFKWNAKHWLLYRLPIIVGHYPSATGQFTDGGSAEQLKQSAC
jgi:hypothetical protein